MFPGPWNSHFRDTLWSPGRDHSEFICGTYGQTSRISVGTLAAKTAAISPVRFHKNFCRNPVGKLYRHDHSVPVN